MKKQYILKDSANKYYIGNWDKYWDRDPDRAHKFDSENEIMNEYFNDKNDEFPRKFLDAVSPLELITIYVLDDE